MSAAAYSKEWPHTGHGRLHFAMGVGYRLALWYAS